MKLMKKIPGGTLLIPMLISALINTFVPNLFHIGGLTEGFFAGGSLNFVLGAAVFMSGCGIKLSLIKNIVKRYGLLLIFRILINTVCGVLFVKIFGLEGFWGLSAIAFICTLTSINPSLFLALSEDMGDETDQLAFGFVSIFALPFIPMFIYGLTMPTQMDFMPIISTLIPLIAGIAIGNLDPDLGKFLSSGMSFMILMLGWSVGAKIHLIEAAKAGIPGLIMLVLFYLLSALPMYGYEHLVQKRDGFSSIAICSAAGLSASVPFLMLDSNPEIAEYASQASAIVALCVIATAIITPLLARQIRPGEKNK